MLDPTLTAQLEGQTGDQYTELQPMADNLPKPKFLGVTQVEGHITITGAIRHSYLNWPDNQAHAMLATQEQVVEDMLDAFDWNELK